MLRTFKWKVWIYIILKMIIQFIMIQGQIHDSFCVWEISRQQHEEELREVRLSPEAALVSTVPTTNRWPAHPSRRDERDPSIPPEGNGSACRPRKTLHRLKGQKRPTGVTGRGSVERTKNKDQSTVRSSEGFQTGSGWIFHFLQLPQSGDYHVFWIFLNEWSALKKKFQLSSSRFLAFCAVIKTVNVIYDPL